MNEHEDIELLRQYAEEQSDVAFETLVKRHVNLVYSAARRSVERPDDAKRSLRRSSSSLRAKREYFVKARFSQAGCIRPHDSRPRTFGARKFAAPTAKRKHTCNPS